MPLDRNKNAFMNKGANARQRIIKIRNTNHGMGVVYSELKTTVVRWFLHGGRCRIRTYDPLGVNEML